MLNNLLKFFKKFFYFIFPLFIIILIWAFTATSQTRCSKFGIYLLDSIFGLDGVGKTCYDVNLRIHLPVIPVPSYYSDTNNKKKRECPTNSPVIVIIGQSNAANYAASYILEDKNNLNYNPADNFCYELSEPVLGATGGLDSLTSSLGKKIKGTKPIIFINTSVGGSLIEEWIQKQYAQNLNNILKKILNKNYLIAIIWIQGESESILSSKNYYTNFQLLKNIIFKDLNIKFQDINFLITKSTYCDNKSEDYNLKQKEINIQRELIKNQYQNIKLLEITDNLDNSYRHDNCHFNRKGVEIISTKLAEVINLLNK